jgi:hypothetical protein
LVGHLRTNYDIQITTSESSSRGYSGGGNVGGVVEAGVLGYLRVAQKPDWHGCLVAKTDRTQACRHRPWHRR